VSPKATPTGGGFPGSDCGRLETVALTVSPLPAEGTVRPSFFYREPLKMAFSKRER